MYALEFIYHSKEPIYADTATFCLGVELFLRGLHSVQVDECVLEFESERDLLLAMLYIDSVEHPYRIKDSSFL